MTWHGDVNRKKRSNWWVMVVVALPFAVLYDIGPREWIQSMERRWNAPNITE